MPVQRLSWLVALLLVISGCSSTPAVDVDGSPQRSAGATISASPSGEANAGMVQRVNYPHHLGEFCGLTASGHGATILACVFPADSKNYTELIGTDVESATRVDGNLASEIAFDLNPSRAWLPVWEQDGDRRMATLYEVDTNSGQVASWDLGDGIVSAVASSGGRVFVGRYDGRVQSVVPDLEAIARLSSPIRSLTLGDGKLWVVHGRGELSVVELDTNKVHLHIAQLPKNAGYRAVVAGGRLFVTGDSLMAVDASGTIQRIDVPGSQVTNVELCGGNIWVAQKRQSPGKAKSGLRALSTHGVVTEQVEMPFPGYLACGGDYLWAVTSERQLYKIKVD